MSPTGSLNFSEIDPGSFFGKISFKQNGSKFKIHERDISILKFADFKGQNKTWLSEERAGFLNPDENLIEERFMGKLSWYSDYNPNKGTGAIAVGAVVGGMVGGAIMGATVGGDKYIHWFKEAKEDQIKMKSLKTDELKLLMSDRPDLLHRIEQMKEENDLISILRDYDIGKEATKARLEKEIANSPYGKLKKIEEEANFDTLVVSNANDLKRKDLVLYIGRSGNILGEVLNIKSSKLIEFRYYPHPKVERVYSLPLRDIRKIVLKEYSDD